MSKNADRIIELTKKIQAGMQELGDLKAKIQSEGRKSTPEEREKANEIMEDVKIYSEELDLERKEMDLNGVINKTQRDPIKPELLNEDALQKQFPGLPPKNARFATFGEQLMAIRAANPQYEAYKIDARLQARATGMSEGTPTDGGFLVQQDFSSELMRRVYAASPVVSRVRRIPIGANSNGIKINAIAESSRASSVWGGIIMYWLGEGATKTASRPEFRQMELELHKVAGLYYATDELIQDATALEGLASAGFTEALDVELEDVIINGTGAGQPLGIMNSGSKIAVSAETGQLAATIQFENIINMWARLWSRSMPNAVWLISQSVLPQLMTMGITVGTAGAPVWLPPNGLADAPYGTLMGRPIFAIENCQTLGTEGDIILADLSQYLMIDKGGPQMASSIHVNFLYDETCFRIVYRCDGQPAWNTTLTPRDSSNTVSPFITLETRS